MSLDPNTPDYDQRYRDWLDKNANAENCHYIRLYGADDGMLLAEEQGWGFSDYLEEMYERERAY